MQDLSTTSTSTSIEAAPSAGGLPPDLFERIAAADVVILIGSSEQRDQALTVQTVLASPMFEPGTIASHAYALAVQQAHRDLLRTVRGEPTDAERYRAFRAFATMQDVDPARYGAINTMVMRFEENNLNGSQKGTPEYMDQVSDFLVHALAETAPQTGAADTNAS